jgi:hypothetical protein
VQRHPHLAGSPDAEHARSVAATRVAELAQRSELLFSHYEHRVRLPLPAHFQVALRPDLSAEVRFERGVLKEPKYQAFRHDAMVASFHPGHRAKWTAHELCHRLVGFAWKPGASSLFDALSAWMSELLPVALWYFFDEAGLRRCPDHQGQGPLFQSFCTHCETAALLGPVPPGRTAQRFTREGVSFVKRELLAIKRSQKLGRPVGTRHASIDLASDGMTYAKAHGPRLRAPEMERFITGFFGPNQGRHASLEALEARVLEVCDGITQGTKVRPWRATRWDWIAQDLGYRLLTVRATLDGSREKALDAIIDALATTRSAAGVTRAVEQYAAFSELSRGRRARGLPRTEDVLAVGYDLPHGFGHGFEQLASGIASACPNAVDALGRKRRATIAAFIAQDAPLRMPIGRRFAAFLAEERPGAVADLAQLEAALTHLGPQDAFSANLDPNDAAADAVQLSDGAELVALQYEVLEADPRSLSKLAPLPDRMHLCIVRNAEGDADVIELPAQAALLLEDGRAPSRAALGLSEEAITHLLALGALRPTRYRM